jgi:hypothetical protein
MERITRKKNENFTVISNEILKNENVSLKAKGLHCVIMGLPDNWDFTIKGMAAILKDKTTAIYSAINELIEVGYCKRIYYTKEYEGKKVRGGVEYIFYENLNLENLDLDNLDLENQPQIRTKEKKELITNENTNSITTPEILENKNEISLIKTEEERKKVAPKKENKPQPQKFKVPKYESVSFTLDQMRALEERFGSDTEWIIKTLHNYKMSSGKKYKSDYHAIFTWVIDKYNKEKKPQKIGSMNVSNMPKYDFDNIPDPLKDFR